jgi:hypothetical protein
MLNAQQVINYNKASAYFFIFVINFKIMKVLVEIPDNKASSLMDVLRSISYVKAKPLTDAKALLMEEIREAVEEMKLIRAGKKKARNAEDFLNEL